MGRVLFIKKFRVLSHFLRNISSEILTNELNNGIRKEIEEYWSKRLIPKQGSDNFYASSVLYPNSIMHSNNLRVLAIRNVILRYHQMNDCQVHEAESWHLLQNPVENRYESFCRLKKLIVDTKSQLEKFRLTVADRELSCDSSEFCRRSQSLFLKLYNAGVIYQKKELINDNAEDQSRNHHAMMYGKPEKLKVSKRWYLKTSQFANDFRKHVYSGEGIPENYLDRFHQSLLGWYEGFSFDCCTDTPEVLNIWVQKLEDIPQAKFVAVAPWSLFAHLYGANKDAHGKLKVNAINPITSKKLPIYSYVDVLYMNYWPGREALMGIPTEYKEHRWFAEQVGLIYDETYEFRSSAAEKPDLKYLEMGPSHDDWPISKNDVASVPVPLVHCPECGFQPVPEQELPLTLPQLPEDLQQGDLDLLTETEDWIITVCPNCGGPAEREKMFIDPFFLSCSRIFINDDTNMLVPVDLFTCAGDKAEYQLYCSRFLAYIVHSLGLAATTELPKKFLFDNLGLNRRMPGGGDGLSFDQIMKEALRQSPEESEEKQLTLRNIRNEFGHDFSNLLLLFLSKNENFQLDQNEQAEMLTWQNNLWLTVREFVKIRERPLKFVSPWIDVTAEDKKLKEVRNRSIRLATLDYCETMDMASCIIVLRKMTNLLRTYTREARKLSAEYEKSLSALIIMVAPIMPHFAATLWMAFCSAEGRLTTNDEEIAWNENVMSQKWPKMDDDYEIPVTLRINSDFLIGGTLPRDEISQLTVEKALDIAKKSREVRKTLNKNLIRNIKLKTVPNLQAELIIVAEQVFKPPEIPVGENRMKNENK